MVIYGTLISTSCDTDGLLSQLNALQGTQSSRPAIGRKERTQPTMAAAGSAERIKRAGLDLGLFFFLLRPPRLPLDLNLRAPPSLLRTLAGVDSIYPIHGSHRAHDASSQLHIRRGATGTRARPATWTPDNEPDKNAGRGLRRPSVPAVRAKLEGHTAVHRARRRSGIGGSVQPGTVVAPRVARRVGGEPAWTGGISAAVRPGESLSWNGCDAMR